MQDITNALNTNKTVTIHEKAISYKGWTGSGYAIVDNTTGAGAYMIGGSRNGGETNIPFLSDIMLFFSTTLLDLAEYDSYLDDGIKYDVAKYGKHEYLMRTNFHPSAKISHLDSISKLAKKAGIFGAIVANIIVAANPDLSFGNKVGQISVNTLVFGLITTITPVFAAAGPVSLILLLLSIIAISAIALWINTNLFSYNNSRRRIENYGSLEVLYA